MQLETGRPWFKVAYLSSVKESALQKNGLKFFSHILPHNLGIFLRKIHKKIEISAIKLKIQIL
jgi:hypothetical protein